MRVVFGILFALGLILPSVSSPQLVSAASSCMCFCGTPEEGADDDIGREADAAVCNTKCIEAEKEFIGCYTSADQYPEKSDICWSQSDCKSNNSENEWVDDISECSDQHQATGYCYAPPRTVTVMTAINGETKFTGVTDYVNAIYQMLIPAMAIVAVVMIMIAGLQYILARGNPNAIKQAKQRMTNAIVGMVLLMSAYALANLLDPSLTYIRQLQIPLVKKVILLSDEDKCSTLAALGYGIDSKYTATYGGAGSTLFVDKACGDEGTITDVSKINAQVQAGVWEVGEKCPYSLCSDGMACTFGTPNTCKRCNEAFATDPEEANLETCNAMTSEDKGNQKFVCGYIVPESTVSWGALLPSVRGGGEGACFEVSSTVSSNSINCGALTSIASDGTSGSCRSYDGLIMEAFEGYEVALDHYKTALEQVCVDDPCGLAGTGHKCKVLATTFTEHSNPGNGDKTVPTSIINCARDDQTNTVVSQGDKYYSLPISPCYDRSGKSVDCNVAAHSSPF